MRDGFGITTARPQIAHMLSQESCTKYVDNLCIKILLLPCNSGWARSVGLYGRGFLPTMKLQLPQLPLLVVQGASHLDAPFFLARGRLNSIT